MTIFLVIMDFILDLEYFSPSFMLDRFKFSIYINGIVVQSAQIGACILSCLVIQKMPRKIFAYISLGVLFACSVVLTFIWDQNNEEVTDVGANAAVLALVFIT